MSFFPQKELTSIVVQQTSTVSTVCFGLIFFAVQKHGLVVSNIRDLTPASRTVFFTTVV